MPPPEDRFRYDDEVAAGLSAAALQERFSRFIAEARRLQQACRERIRIFVGMETETYTGSIPFCRALIDRHRPDYVVGSVHHVDDRNFDYSVEHYRAAVDAAGGPASFYIRYFDHQYEMMRALLPQVVGHFDLVRIHDATYRQRMETPEIKTRIQRNLSLVREKNLIVDCNLRALEKGASEPYPTEAILRQARTLGIAVVPGDDSHGVASVGKHFDRVAWQLEDFGFDISWKKPTD